MAVAFDFLARVTAVAHQDFHGQKHHPRRVTERLGVEFAVFAPELHQVQRSQVAGRVAQEHVLAAGIRGLDAISRLAGVPVVDRGVELHARIATDMSAFGDLLHQVAGLVRIHRTAIGHRVGRPLAVGFHGAHEIVVHSY